MPKEIIKNKYKQRITLYPPIEPYKQKMMSVGDGHRIYLEECGNPDGVPIIVIHGGPGGGCSPMMRRFFDPEFYHIILFDQRGCGRSRPYASIENNNTWKLISDIELIRETLGIKELILFGGSWGATLSLLYAQQFPENVRKIILRGVFTMTKAELDWFYNDNGAGKFWPEAWRIFQNLIPPDERDDLILAYNKRLFGSSPADQEKYSRAWTNWENSLASFTSLGHSTSVSTEYAKAFARIENHYFINHGFLDEDGQIFRDLYIIKEIPTSIIQGRYDMICPPITAEKVHSKLSNSNLIMIPEAGHAMSEPGIISALVSATENFKTLY
jgi:proline iminopeptidase